MNSRTLLNIGLLVLLLGLGLLVFFEPGLEPPPARVQLSTLDTDDISHIRIERRDQPSLELVKENGSWFVMHEQAIPTNEFQVRSLLGLINAQVTRSYSTTELIPGDLHLDPPSTSVVFNDKLRIDFGTTESLGRSRYVRLDEQIHLIDDRYQHLVEADFTSFVRNRLLPKDSQINKLQLPNKTLELANKIHWTLTPEDQAVSADAIQELIDHWQRAAGIWVREYEEAPSNKQVRIQLDSTPDPIVFDIVAEEPELILARPDWKIQYHLSEQSSQGLFQFSRDIEEPQDPTATE